MFACLSLLVVSRVCPVDLLKLAVFVLHCGIGLRGIFSFCYELSLETTILTSVSSKSTMRFVMEDVTWRGGWTGLKVVEGEMPYMSILQASHCACLVRYHRCFLFRQLV